MEAIETYGEDLDKKLTTPASSHIFIANEQAKQIDEEKRKLFHSIVAKLLYMMKRAILDLETAISLLCGRLFFLFLSPFGPASVSPHHSRS